MTAPHQAGKQTKAREVGLLKMAHLLMPQLTRHEILLNTLSVHEIGMATPDIVCVQILDGPLTIYPLVGTVAQPAGGTITNIVANPSGGMRVTVANAKNYCQPAVLSVKGAADNGSGAIRLQVYSDADINATSPIYVYNVGGVPNADGTWSFTKVGDGTHIDLVGSTFAGTFTNGGFVSQIGMQGVHPGSPETLPEGQAGLCRRPFPRRGDRPGLRLPPPGYGQGPAGL